MQINKNKFLRSVLYSCLVIIPFLAFYVSGFGIGANWNAMFFPYITGKNFAFRILVEIAAASWLILMIIDKSFRPKKSLLLTVYSIFVFVLLLADIFSVNPVRSFFSNFERMEGFIAHIHLYLYFLMLITLFKDKASWVKYKTVLFISNIPVVVLGLLQLLGLSTFWPMKFLPALRDAIHKVFAPSQGGNQLDSSLGNSTYLAIYTIFFIFLLFITYLENRKKEGAKNWPYIVMIILNLVVLFYTQTRGAQVGFAIGIFVTSIIIYFGGKKFKELKRKRNISLAIILFVLAGYFSLIIFSHTNVVTNSSTLNRLAKVASFADPISLPHKISEIKGELYSPTSTYQSLLAISGDGTFTSRILNIKMSLDGFKARPILGWGQDDYFYVFAKYNDPRMYAQEPWFDRSHNVFMDWLIAAGIVGLIAYLSLYVAAFYMMWHKKFKKENHVSSEFVEKAIISGLLIAYFVHNIFVFDNIVSYILFFIVLAYISVRFGKEKDKVSGDLSKEEINKRKILYVPIVVIGLFLSLYFFNIRYIEANRDIIKGMLPDIQSGTNPITALTNSLDAFKRAIKIGGIAQLESKEQLAQSTLSLLTQIKNANITPTEENKPVYDLVNDYINTTEQAYAEVFEKRVIPRSLGIYTSFLLGVGDNKDALNYGIMAHNSAPHKQSITISYIQALLLNNDYPEAEKVAQQMYNDDSSYDEAKSLLALTEAYNKEFDKAESLLANKDGSINIDQDIMQVYLNYGEGNRLINILKKNISLNGEDSNSTLLLANVYLVLNQKVKAIETLEALKKLLPEKSSVIDDYIKKIQA